MLVRLPVAYRDSHTPPSAPGRPAEDCVAVRRDSGDHSIGAQVVVGLGGVMSSIQETDQPLIDPRLPDDLNSRQSPDPRDQRPRMATTAVDQIGDTVSPQLPASSVG